MRGELVVVKWRGLLQSVGKRRELGLKDIVGEEFKRREFQLEKGVKGVFGSLNEREEVTRERDGGKRDVPNRETA